MTPPADPWRDVCAARLPAAALAALAAVRDRADLRVRLDGPTAWVRWPAGGVDVVRCLLPVPGVTFYSRRGVEWFPFGRRLPTSDGPPPGDDRPLAAVLVPARFTPVPPGFEPGPAAVLKAVRGGKPEPASALACPLAALAAWADRATTAEIASVKAAHAGERVLLLGPRLPTLPGATRYWGSDVLIPLGHRADPDLSPTAVRAAVGAAGDDLVFLDGDGAEVVPRAAFAPPTRAGLRLAARETT